LAFRRSRSTTLVTASAAGRTRFVAAVPSSRM
jgi:hypothetical protein